MPLTVDELSSDVTVEAGEAPGSAAEEPWHRLASFEASRDRLAEDERRVCAKDFDD
jgi:hypothetical protein